MAMDSRRRFMLMAFGVGGAAALGLAALWRNGASAAAAPAAVKDLQTAKKSGYALGTTIHMLALHERAEQAAAGLDAAFAELERVENALSIYRPDSALSRLNRDGVLEQPHPCLVEVLQAAQEMARQSNGAFDVTVQPLWTVYAAAQRQGRLPAEAEIEAARRKVDWRKLEVARDRVRLHGSGMQVTLNGIAQGYAGDRVLNVLRAHGITHALANTGEVAALGGKQCGEPWVAGIQDPREDGALLGLARLDGRCLSTSGDYNTAFCPDKSLNHIFDPATGRSPLDFSSVSIVAVSGMTADALSTAAFVLGAEKGAKLVQATPGAEALFVLKDGRQLKTQGFPLA